MDKKQKIRDIIDQRKDFFTGLGDKIWDLAELRFAVGKSADLLCQALEDEGFKIERGVSGMKHAFIATWGNSGSVVGMLAEFDALDGMSQVSDSPEKKPLVEGGSGHGCGHNALGSGVITAAIGLAAYLKESKTPGTIKVFGCPAEESGYGKAYMARDGVFKQADALLTWHPMGSNNVWGFSTLAVNQLYFKFKGVSSHAGAAPEMGRSALDAAELMNIGVQFLREHIIDSARIHYAFVDVGGTAANVVQASAALHYFIRAAKQAQAVEITDRVIKIAQGAAMMTETELEVVWDAACAEFIVNKTLGDIMYKNLELVTPLPYSAKDYTYAERFAATLSPAEKARANGQLLKAEISPKAYPDKPMTASTDVGDASWITPTAQVIINYGPYGTGPHSWQWVATGKSNIAHTALLTAGKVLAMSALDILESPEVITQAKKEHQQNLAGQVYRSVLPENIKPEK